MPSLPPDPSLLIADEARKHQRTFVFMPSSWCTFSHHERLEWHTVRFEAAQRKLIPRRSGVYGFLLQPGIADGLDASYLMYIGETTSLYERFGDYLGEAHNPEGRVKLRDMFSKYSDYLQFTYAFVPPEDIKIVQDNLIMALWPPVNSDLPAKIRAANRVLS